MSVQFTEQEFSKHVNTKFRIAIEEPVELELTEVKGYMNKENEQPGMERFSVYFNGPDRYLPQHVYPIEHEQMGAFELFLVPVGKHDNGFRYEAVFNYFKAMAVD
ncbi:MAG TPA: hypothetical protein VJM50_03490 [Pyrinomonadaceae bacterium]|nr:hypothetical protein [Pyrinomonadaceae bacterium]